MFNRKDTKKIKVGNTFVGGSDDIIIQSMCNTATSDFQSTIKQILELENAGCEIIRVTVNNIEAANAIDKIKQKIHIPLVADIHFDYKLALMAIDNGIDKIRINPGNIGDENKIKEVVNACKKNHIPIRVGVNSGSISKENLIKYNGVNEKSLVASAVDNIKILEKFSFDDIIISIKASEVLLAVKCYEKIAKIYNYPLHIGITEAGTLYNGNIKSSIGLGILINEGLGNTMRVSLTGDPLYEIKTAKQILNTLNIRKNKFEIVSCPTCGRTEIDIIKIANDVENKLITYEKSGKLDEILKSKNLQQLKIAVMGCAVNGPGEAKNCDIGIAGGRGEGLIFEHGNIIKKVDEDRLVEELFEILK